MPFKTFAFRLGPGADLRKAIEDTVNEQDIRAGWVITCVGSLSHYHLRFANQSIGTSGDGYHEILSLVGTLSVHGCHLHICLANDTGSTIGGHLLEGCIVYTTAEIIIGRSKEYVFDRQKNDQTGWKELIIHSVERGSK